MTCENCDGCSCKKCGKPMLKLAGTEDYEALNELFERNELEISAEEPVSTDAVKGWALTCTGCQDGKIVGGAVLAKREGRYIIDGIAIDEEYRAHDMGSMLLGKAVEEVKKRRGDSIYLVARAPKFFEKHGFREIERENAPQFFECFTCPQYGDSCNPKVMRLDLQ